MKIAWISGALLLAAAQAAPAQPGGWKPERNVEIISPAAAGGGTDVTARLVRSMIEKQRLVAVASSVVNKGGGGGAETWAYLDQRRGDGHYLAISTPPLLTGRITGVDRYTYTDFTSVTILYNEYVLIAVRADSPIKTGRDLAARLRQDASSISVAVAPSLGSHNHVAPALVAKVAGGDARRLRVEVFDTGTKAGAAVADGRLDIVSSTTGTLLALVQAGKLRPLGLAAPKRLGGLLATVPTWKEQGVDVVLPSWRGIVGPRGMTPAQVAYWEEVFLKLSFNDEWLAELSKRGWDGTYLNGSETRKFLDGQFKLLKEALGELGLAK
jgi:putative tricarboxylic transport membrane protein